MLSNHEVLLIVHENAPGLLPLHTLAQANHLKRLVAVEIPAKLEPAAPHLGIREALPQRRDVQRLRVADLVRVDDYVRYDVLQVRRRVVRRVLRRHRERHLRKLCRVRGGFQGGPISEAFGPRFLRDLFGGQWRVWISVAGLVGARGVIVVGPGGAGGARLGLGAGGLLPQ